MNPRRMHPCPACRGPSTFTLTPRAHGDDVWVCALCSHTLTATEERLQAEITALRAELARRTIRPLAPTASPLMAHLRLYVDDASAEHAVFESRWPAQVPMRWCAETPLVHVPGLRYEGFSYNAHVTPAPPFVIGTVKA